MFNWPPPDLITTRSHFPYSRCRPVDWSYDVRVELQKFRQVIDLATPIDESHYIDLSLANIRTPTIEEQIHQSVCEEAEKWKSKLNELDEWNGAVMNKAKRRRTGKQVSGDTANCSVNSENISSGGGKQISEAVADLAAAPNWKRYNIDLPSSKKDLHMKEPKRHNRSACRLPLEQSDPCAFEWSEHRLFIKSRRETRLESYKLSHDFDDYRFKRSFVSHNFSTDPHGNASKALLESSRRNTLLQNLLLAAETPVSSSAAPKSCPPHDQSTNSPLGDSSKSPCNKRLLEEAPGNKNGTTTNDHTPLRPPTTFSSQTSDSSILSNFSPTILSPASTSPSQIPGSTNCPFTPLIIPPSPSVVSLTSPINVDRSSSRAGQQWLGVSCTPTITPMRSLSSETKEQLAQNNQQLSDSIAPLQSIETDPKLSCIPTPQEASSHSSFSLSLRSAQLKNCDSIVDQSGNDTHGGDDEGPPRSHSSNMISSASLVSSTPLSHNLSRVKSTEVIVTISFYHPVRGLKSAEFDILGEQTLSDLKDSFICDEDLTFYSRRYPWSCFFIDGVFYSDDRDPHITDYSTRLAEHLMKHAPGKIHPTCYRQSMESTIICQTELLLNQRCAYLHRGDCEHRMVFTSVRQFDPQFDCPYREAYPLRVYEPAAKVTLCQACLLTAAAKSVFNSTQLPSNPTLLCMNCFDSFFRSSTGR